MTTKLWQMMMKNFGRILPVLAACIFMTGCAWSVGGKKGGTTVNKPTQGAELIDLQKAHESGAITDDEYKRLRDNIVGG